VIQSITSLKLEELLSSKDFFLIDVRPSAAFNGWQLRNEVRGGHIPGAISFPFEWFDDLGNKDAAKKLAEKGITREKSIIVTGYGQPDIETASIYLEEIGFTNILVHSEGMPG
jgi:thiosulfate/3-mercaptopyruvate sulfurtransferase